MKRKAARGQDVTANFQVEATTDQIQRRSTQRVLRRFGPGVVELTLLLRGEEAVALEAAAYERGWTAAQLVRRILRDLLSGN